MKVVIVGAGAIGGLFGALLAGAGNDVCMVDNDPEVIKTISDRGITLTKKSGETESVRVRATKNGKDVTACDLVILAVKCFSTEEAVKGVCHLVHDDTAILTLQTGIGNITIARSIVPEKNILGGVTYNGSTILSPGRVRFAAPGETFIGEIDGSKTRRTEEISRIFNDAGLPTHISYNILGHIWSKAILYSAINPLTAIFHFKNGQLLSQEETVFLMKEIVREGIEVSERAERRLIYDDPYKNLFSLCEKTSENLSPMFQDILNNRKTEINGLNGAIARWGSELGIDTPVNNIICKIIKILEKEGNSHLI